MRKACTRITGLARGLFVLAALVATGAAPASAAEALIAFDDLPTNSNPGESYAALGVHFSAGDNGIKEGIANGDPENWDLDGTRGPNFLGFNGGPSYEMTLTFDFPARAFRVDVSSSGGSEPADTFTIEAFRGGELVETQTIEIGDINVWTTVSLAAERIDRVHWIANGADFHPYGIDYIRFVPMTGPVRCYAAKDLKQPAKFAGATADVADALGLRSHDLKKPVSVCLAGAVDGLGAADSEAVLVCYQVKDSKTDPPQTKFAPVELATEDGFGELGLQARKPTTVCVPATELAP
jgi:hypothetical protein